MGSTMSVDPPSAGGTLSQPMSNSSAEPAEIRAAEVAEVHEAPARRRGTAEVEDEDAGRKRLLLLVPLVMAAAAIVVLVLVGMQDKGMYSKPVDQLMAEKTKFLGKPVRAEGNLVHGSLVKRETPCEYRFTMEKNGVEVPVRFPKCVVPDTFRDVQGMDVAVTVEGQLGADDTLEATQVLAKCPSKYEMKQKAASGEQAPHASMPSL